MIIDVSRFEKIAEYRNGEYKSYMKHHRPHEPFYGVYLINFGGNKNYIGVSNHLHKRVRQHYSGMVLGNNDLPQLNEAYKKAGQFTVFLLNGKKGSGIGEDEFIYALKPSLNRMIPFPNKISLNSMKEIASIIGVSLSELVADEDQTCNKIRCPHCGAEIHISVD